MESINNVRDFRRFMELNMEKIRSNAVKASDISIQDEWMKEHQWDQIYKQKEKKEGGEL